MKKNLDILIIGAGSVGCVLTERLSSQLNLKCAIIKNRNHIAANCYDEYNKECLLHY